MKLLFFGDVMFGRDGNQFSEFPFKNVINKMKKQDAIFFNLETTISTPLLSENYKQPKVFNYQATNVQLKNLKKSLDLSKQKVFVSTANNHSLDYSEKGFNNTIKTLKSLGYLSNAKNKVENENFIFVNYTDHCGCDNESLWMKYINFVNYNDTSIILNRIRKLRKTSQNKVIVFSIHWGPNWVQGEMSNEINKFARDLIDAGVDIVFGHSAHHIVKTPVIKYKDGIVIFGLGDFINDYAVNKSYKSNLALMCEVTITKKGKKNFNLVLVDRIFNGGSSIPHYVL